MRPGHFSHASHRVLSIRGAVPSLRRTVLATPGGAGNHAPIAFDSPDDSPQANERTAMIRFLIDIVSHTPVGVWIGLAVLVALGLAQTRDRDVSAARLWLVPIVTGTLSFLGTWHSFGGAGQWLAAGGWVVGGAAGFASNRALDLPRRAGANADGTFRIGGSFAPLLLFVSIFALRYAVGVALAIAPQLAHESLAALLVGVATGLPAGLLAARSHKVLTTRRPAGALLAA